jgi:hypothetical protein
LNKLRQPGAEYDYLPANYESSNRGEPMFIFIAGMVVGSIAMLFTMSLMFAAKRGDEQIEAFFKEKAY